MRLGYAVVIAFLSAACREPSNKSNTRPPLEISAAARNTSNGDRSRISDTSRIVAEQKRPDADRPGAKSDNSCTLKKVLRESILTQGRYVGRSSNLSQSVRRELLSSLEKNVSKICKGKTARPSRFLMPPMLILNAYRSPQEKEDQIALQLLVYEHPIKHNAKKVVTITLHDEQGDVSEYYSVDGTEATEIANLIRSRVK
jgi:hypothetical protein